MKRVETRDLRVQVASRAVAAAVSGGVCAAAWVAPESTWQALTPPSERWRWVAAALAAWVAIALAWSAGRMARRPWNELRTTLEGRDGEEDTPLPRSGPADVQPALAALDLWIARRREAGERQQRLLGDVSHQLRTPLAVMRTILQGTAPENLGAHREELLRTIDRTTAVVNEMLARMKLDQRRAGSPAASLQRLDSSARDAAIEFAPLIGTRELRFELQAEPLAVPADAWMLGELVRNLLANAIRHSPPDGALGIVVRMAHDGPELIVWDSGPGLGDGPRERLFEPFAAASGGGIGLGLSICRELAQAMGARVELYNRTDGHRVIGVDAVVRWPAAAAPSPLPATHPHEGDPR